MIFSFSSESVGLIFGGGVSRPVLRTMNDSWLVSGRQLMGAQKTFQRPTIVTAARCRGALKCRRQGAIEERWLEVGFHGVGFILKKAKAASARLPRP
jgi:hypothetical protein